MTGFPAFQAHAILPAADLNAALQDVDSDALAAAAAALKAETDAQAGISGAASATAAASQAEADAQTAISRASSAATTASAAKSEADTNTTAIGSLQSTVSTHTTQIAALQSGSGSGGGSGPAAQIFFNGAYGGTLDADGTPNTSASYPLIRKSINIAALTHLATGSWSVSFTKPFADTWYTLAASGQFDTAINDFTQALISEPRGAPASGSFQRTTSSLRFNTTYQGTSSTGFDIHRVGLTIFA